MTFAFLEPQSGVEYAYNLPWLTNDKISADKLSRRLAAPLSLGNDLTAFYLSQAAATLSGLRL